MSNSRKDIKASKARMLDWWNKAPKFEPAANGNCAKCNHTKDQHMGVKLVCPTHK